MGFIWVWYGLYTLNDMGMGYKPQIYFIEFLGLEKNYQLHFKLF